MKVSEIEISRTYGGVISDAPFENCRPSFTDSVHLDIDEQDDESEIRKLWGRKLQEDLMVQFDMLKNNLKAQAVERQFSNIRFYEKDGKKYPSVTSVTGWNKDFHVSDIDLQQYGARGTIIHFMIDEFIKTGAWLTLKEVAERGLRSEATIMFKGGLQLKIEDCSHEAFFAEFGKDFKWDDPGEVTIYNDKYLYAGRYDRTAKYKGVRSLIDFKTGVWDYKQLSAYSNGDGMEGIEQLVVCLVGPNDNKSGVKKPSVTKNVSGYFDEFLKDRAEFTKRFGI